MNKKFPILTPRLPEGTVRGHPGFLRDPREAADRAIAEGTASHSGNKARTVVNSVRAWGPTLGAPSGGRCTQSHDAAVNAWHCPSVWKVAA